MKNGMGRRMSPLIMGFGEGNEMPSLKLSGSRIQNSLENRVFFISNLYFVGGT